uniref:Uncharacterized protein n=1 Tax=Arundo donax TaxID=35708 RepID=A0A0A9H2U0_ARUDO
MLNAFPLMNPFICQMNLMRHLMHWYLIGIFFWNFSKNLILLSEGTCIIVDIHPLLQIALQY